ncbi:MAG TPA: hypothetical protein VK097_02870 [Lentibacillus sp.]|uniref:hypothetical protein n=1 Tax=Lentibacillus sp. TaxID=1925746 RepID=UPI002B4AE5B2|nr:hypothetical protein [Lentibacillus sp.]HLR61363.1 hypothetical protein [Lentibacillus sp.]
MKKKIPLQNDENIISSITGLFEYFTGEQNVYFGDLLLTNKRLYLVGKNPINIEESLWFNGEERENRQSTLIVGDHYIRIRWNCNGNLLEFIKMYQHLNL